MLNSDLRLTDNYKTSILAGVCLLLQLKSYQVLLGQSDCMMHSSSFTRLAMGSFEYFSILVVGLVVVSRTCDAINCQFVAPPETAGTDGPELGLIFIPGRVS